MKKIYTITLEDDTPLSDNFENDLRIICYLLYDNIRDMEENPGMVLYQNNLLKNELLDNFNGKNYDYKFISEEDNYEWQKYEPFIISGQLFGFTAYSDQLTDNDIIKMLANIQHLIGTDYKFKIISYLCEKDSERNHIITALGHELANENHKKKHRVLIKTVLSMLRI